MKKWVCPNCESINSGITLCDVCDFENPKYPLVRINSFSISKDLFFEEEEINIKWNIDNYKKLQLKINDEIKTVSKSSSYKYYPKLKLKNKEVLNIQLIIFDALGNEVPHSKKLKKKVTVTVKPKIKKFSISKDKILLDEEINVNWNISDYSKLILIKNETEKIDVSELTKLSFSPKEVTSLYIKVHCIDSDIIFETEKKSITVVKPIDISFVVDKKYTIESQPIRLSWTTESAVSVKIESVFDIHKDLSLSGFIESYPSKECVYKLTASNDVEVKEQLIHINVFPIPSVKHINIPALPQLMGSLSFPNIDLTEKDLIINEDKSLKQFYFNKVEKHFVMNKFINLYTNGSEILQKINNKIYG